jgi:hypothetical protein
VTRLCRFGNIRRAGQPADHPSRLITGAPAATLAPWGGVRWAACVTRWPMNRTSSPAVVAPCRRRHVPPFRDRALVEAAADPDLDLRPWAAYTLGFEGHVLPIRLSLYRRQPEPGWGTAENVVAAAGCLRTACDILAPELSQTVHGELMGVLGSLEGFIDAMAGEWENTGRIDWDDRTPEAYLDRLIVLANGDLAVHPSLAQWFKLGRSIGRWFHQDDAFNELERAPFRPVVEAVHMLPPRDRSTEPHLTDLARLAGRFDPKDEYGLRLAVAHGPLKELYLPPELRKWNPLNLLPRALHTDAREIAKMQAICDELARRKLSTVDPYRFWMAVWKLAGLLNRDLRRVRRMGDRSTGTSEVKPSWNRDVGQLFFQGEVIKRVVVGKATRIVAVLDEFQRHNWRSRIDDPIHLGSQALHDTIDSLNQRLGAIHFRSDGTGKGIVREPRSET